MTAFKKFDFCADENAALTRWREKEREIHENKRQEFVIHCVMFRSFSRKEKMAKQSLFNFSGTIASHCYREWVENYIRLNILRTKNSTSIQAENTQATATGHCCRPSSLLFQYFIHNYNLPGVMNIRFDRMCGRRAGSSEQTKRMSVVCHVNGRTCSSSSLLCECECRFSRNVRRAWKEIQSERADVRQIRQPVICIFTKNKMKNGKTADRQRKHIPL